MNRQLSARDHRMARTICTICLGYLFCNMPIIVMKYVRGNDTDDIPYVRFVVSCLYFMQYRSVQLDFAPEIIRVFFMQFIRCCIKEKDLRGDFPDQNPAVPSFLCAASTLSCTPPATSSTARPTCSTCGRPCSASTGRPPRRRRRPTRRRFRSRR